MLQVLQILAVCSHMITTIHKICT